MTKYTAGGLLLATLLLGAAAAHAEAVIHKTTPPGQAVKVRNHVKLGSNCGGGAPDISFSVNPAHGKVEIKPDRFLFGAGYATGTNAACAGRQVDGVAIWYTPDAGFHGTDHMEWTADFGGRGKNRQVDTHAADVTVP